MQRRSLTHSRHTSTIDTPATSDTRFEAFRGTFVRGTLATGITTALLGGVLAGGVLTGIAHAAPERPHSPAAEPEAKSEAQSEAQSDAKPQRKPQRNGAITVRERRTAREVIRQQVADLATRQLGDAYRSGAEGPDAFDCSGLTLFAWQSAGVQLTHYSAGQYQQVKRIRPEAAMPGDLVFYLSGGARHVGVYVGDGMLVHASDYGVGVIRTPVRGTPWTNAHFTGFGRVIIPENAIKETVKEIRQRRGRA